MKKYFIITYGCQQNISDSTKIAFILEKNNFKPCLKINEADLIIVNACSIRQSAIDRLNGLFVKFKKIRKKNKKLKTVLTGCLLEKDRKRLRNYFNFILPIKTLKKWPQILKEKEAYPFFSQRDISFNKRFKGEYLNITSKQKEIFSLLVPISSGCDNFCTYCVVPYTRGPLVCRSHKNILREIKKATKNGLREVWLLGENVNDYHSPSDKSINFSKLLKKINEIPGDFWIRFTSPHPKNFSKELINQLPKYNKVTEYINIPVQSGNNEILKRMNRSYKINKYKEIIKDLRKNTPNIAISTDVIVGFPGETKTQFNDTVKLFKEIGFDMAYISKYSKRKGTEAAKLEDNVSLDEKIKRVKKLTDILRKSALKNNKKYIGQTVRVLINKKNEGFLYGKSRAYKTVRIKDDNKILVGDFIEVKITDAYPWGLKGEKQLPKLIVILGPTASGKTGIGIKLSQDFNGEIISADSKQIYKEISIGTAKPTTQERSTIKHHLVDIVSLKENFNVSTYKKLAIEAIGEIIKEDKQPLLVGGTGLYIKSVIDNFSLTKIPPNDKIRKRLEKKTIEELFDIYKKLDPKGAQKIDGKNKRRLVRAVEVCEITKKPFWEQRKNKEPLFDVLQIGIKLSAKKLKEKTIKRTNQMLKLGLEKEAKEAIKKYRNSPSLATIGYQEWFPFYQKFSLTKKEIEEIKKSIILHTLQFSKRQLTWFKKDKRIKWIKDYKEAKKLVKSFLEK